MLICILAPSLCFHAITFERSIFTKNASVALNPLVSLFGRLVARSGRKRGNRQTDRQTDGMTSLRMRAEGYITQFVMNPLSGGSHDAKSGSSAVPASSYRKHNIPGGSARGRNGISRNRAQLRYNAPFLTEADTGHSIL